MDQVEEVKNKLDIVEVVGRYMELKRGGRNFKGLCPFHGEKSPSFMVNPELQIYKCFGCQEGGDVISFVQKMEGLEFVEALKMLADQVGVKLSFKGDEKKSEKDEMVAIHELAVEYYHYLLTQHRVGEEARKYLKSRKVNEKIISEFKLGYALPAWDGLYTFLVLKKKKNPKLVEMAGLIMESSKRKGQYYDRFRDRIIFPLQDHRGVVVGFSGRVLPGSREAESSPKYINSPETLIYHKSEMLFGLIQAKKAMREKDRVVLVEGEVDMISSFMAGVSETVAIKGSALTLPQIERLKRITNNLVLALDADAAGDAAMKRGIQLAEEKGMNMKVIQVVGGKDPDDIARENPLLWRKMVEKAVDIYQFYIDSSRAKNDPNTVEGKRKITEEVLPVLAKIKNKVVQAFYVKKLAGILGISEEGVEKELERVMLGLGPEKIEKKEVKKEKSREEKLLSEILSLVLSTGSGRMKEQIKKLLQWIGDSTEAKILEKWLVFIEGGGEVAEFIKNLPPELLELSSVAYIEGIEMEKSEDDLEEAIEEFKRLRLKEELQRITKEISLAEEEENEEKLKELQERFASLSKTKTLK